MLVDGLNFLVYIYHNSFPINIFGLCWRLFKLGNLQKRLKNITFEALRCDVTLTLASGFRRGGCTLWLTPHDLFLVLTTTPYDHQIVAAGSITCNDVCIPKLCTRSHVILSVSVTELMFFDPIIKWGFHFIRYIF